MKVNIYVRLECSLSFDYLIQWWLIWHYTLLSFQGEGEGSECTDKDLLHISSTVQVHVWDVVYELLGEISSDESDTELEQYLIMNNNEHSDLQGMAKMKQTARKQELAAGTSGGGLPLATRSRRGVTFDSNSSIERAADVLSSDSNMSSRSTRRSPRKKPSQTGFTSTEDEEPAVTSTETMQEAPRKDLKKIKRKGKPPMKELCHQWNKSGRIGLDSETARGWLKKTEKKRNAQGRVLQRAHPGTTALREIRHYQRCQTLMATLPFQWLVREVCLDLCSADLQLRWQSNALFTFQTTAEAYLAGFYNDVNLCAVHHKVVTINRKDVWLAVQLRGRDHIGGMGQVSDIGAMNVSNYQVADQSELKWQRSTVRAMSAEGRDWNYDLREVVAKDKPDPLRQGKGGKGTLICCHKVLKKAIYRISKVTFLRQAWRGGVKRFSGNIYKESRGVLKVFVEEIVKDVITFCEYKRRKTVTPLDVIFALKQHGRENASI